MAISLAAQPISRKLPAVVAALAALAALATGTAGYLKAASDRAALTATALAEAAVARRDALEAYLATISRDLDAVATNPHTLEALTALRTGYAELGTNAEAALQKAYITDNPHPLGQKENLDTAEDGSIYSQAHARLHGWFRSFLRNNGYYDIFLFDTDGDLVYTVFKELDFATNLRDGRWSDTGLGRVFKGALAGETVFDDFKPYAPSADAPAAFIARPIRNASGEIVGVLAFQMPIGNINATMATSDSNGASGETLLVGEDGLVRNQSRFAAEAPILSYEVPAPMLSATEGSKAGVISGVNRDGAPTRAGFAGLTYFGNDWVVVSDITKAEADAPLNALARDLGLAALLIGLLATAAGVWFARSLTRPLSALNGAMTRMAQGDLSLNVPGTDRADELGAMAKTVEVFRANGLRQRELEAQTRADAEARVARARMIEQLTATFERQSADGLRAVGAAATELEATARAMTENADRTSHMAANVAAGAEESGANAQTAAASAENLVNAISHIERAAQNSGRVTATAVTKAREATATVRSLSDTARRIGEVVDLIKGIADQTNLLALNATIEAARAGDAGRGFAIVASEVKSLANQTGAATEDIAGQITAIQTAIREVVSAIDGIDATISLVSKEAEAINNSVSMQTAVTNDIARNVREVSAAAGAVAGDISQVTQTAGETGAAANQVLAASRELAERADQLRNEVSNFLDRMKAA
jgi:methyl-accepting chemotaxis protein